MSSAVRSTFRCSTFENEILFLEAINAAPFFSAVLTIKGASDSSLDFAYLKRFHLMVLQSMIGSNYQDIILRYFVWHLCLCFLSLRLLTTQAT
jgi:hypothetical protein